MYLTVDLLREAIDSETSCGNVSAGYVAVHKLPERWHRCVKNKREYLVKIVD